MSTLLERAHRFVEDSQSVHDESLPALLKVDDALRAVYGMLARHPARAEESAPLVDELRAERRRLLERVGENVLARARAIEEVAPAASSSETSNDIVEEPEPASEKAEPLVPSLDDAPIRDLASPDALEEWKRIARAGGLGQASYEDHAPPTWELALNEVLAKLGPPRDLDLETAEELDALDRVGQPPLFGTWGLLPREVQREWLGLLVARTRALKDLDGLSSPDRARVKTIIARYPAWAAEHKPGHVNGMRLSHTPTSASWAMDARHMWASLGARLAGTVPPSRPNGARKRPADAASLSVGDDEPKIPHGWPLWPLVRGRRALMVGGDPREPNRERLERTFDLGSLEWPDVGGPRKVEALVSRIKQRTVDVVIVLRGFVDHKQSEPIVAAAKEASVGLVVADGYGASAMKQGMERFLGPGRG